MKPKNLFILFIMSALFFYACGQVPAYRQLSSFNGDTLAYLKYNFEVRKDYYSGKSMEILLKDLEIQIKCMYPTTNAPKNDGICKGLLVSFEDQFNTENKTSNNSKLCLMDIDFLSEISLDSVYAMVRALDRNEWGPTFQNYFASKIISTLRVYVNPSSSTDDPTLINYYSFINELDLSQYNNNVTLYDDATLTESMLVLSGGNAPYYQYHLGICGTYCGGGGHYFSLACSIANAWIKKRDQELKAVLTKEQAGRFDTWKKEKQKHNGKAVKDEGDDVKK